MGFEQLRNLFTTKAVIPPCISEDPEFSGCPREEVEGAMGIGVLKRLRCSRYEFHAN